MTLRISFKIATTTALVLAACGAQAQQITLKVHHFLPSTSSSQVKLIQP